MGTTRRIAVIASTDGFLTMAVERTLVDVLGFESVSLAGSLEEGAVMLEGMAEDALALFDLGLPDVTDAACLGSVRERFPGARIVAVAEHGRRSDVLAALEAGLHGFVPKTIGPARLADALRYVIDGNVYVPPTVTEVPARHAGAEPARRMVRAEVNGAQLTPRQRDVLEQVVLGLSNKEIARALNMGEGTVKIHLGALFRIFGTSTRAALAVAGMRMGMGQATALAA